MVAGYSLALASSRRTTILAGLALVPSVVVAIALFGHDDVLFTTAEIPKNLAFVAAPLLLGSAVRERRAAHAALVERAETAERTREEEALRRVGEERLRIARDVHDVVAHAMVAINVQAGVGAHLLDRDPEQARRTLAGHQEGQRRGARRPARRRSAPCAPPRTTRPPRRCGRRRACGELDDLASWREPPLGRGRGRRSTSTRPPRPLPASVTTTGYRIVQEALTNVVRHAQRLARPGARDPRGRPGRHRRRATTAAAPSRSARPPPGGTRQRRARACASGPQAAGGTLEAGPRRGGRLAGAARPCRSRRAAVTIRVLLADDQTLVRAGFRALLESEDDIEVVGEAVDGARRSRWPPRPGPTSC